MKTVRRISVMFLATLALAACSSGQDGNDVPSGWIRGEYAASGPDHIDPGDPASVVASEIDGHAAARDRIEDGDKVLLRYRDDIVAISPYRSGSRIEIADYRTGYHRWKSHIRGAWPNPDSDGFRGGGPGTGK